MGHIVIRQAVKVSIGAAGGNKVAQLLRRGDVVPEGVSEESLADLVERGYLEEVDLGNAEIVPEGAEGVEVPDGAPAASWTVPQIDLWASRQDPPIAFDASAKKDEKLAAIAKLSENKS